MSNKRGTYVDVKATQASLGKAASEIYKSFDDQLGKAAREIENTAKRSIQRGGRSGRSYSKGKGGKIRHQASAPGEYPKTDEGALVANIFSEKVQRLWYRVGSRGKGAPHGKWLQFGTQKMAARPWLTMAIRDSLAKVSELVHKVRPGSLKVK